VENLKRIWNRRKVGSRDGDEGRLVAWKDPEDGGGVSAGSEMLQLGGTGDR
jgi:hypothetical protein